MASLSKHYILCVRRTPFKPHINHFDSYDCSDRQVNQQRVPFHDCAQFYVNTERTAIKTVCSLTSN